MRVISHSWSCWKRIQGGTQSLPFFDGRLLIRDVMLGKELCAQSGDWIQAGSVRCISFVPIIHLLWSYPPSCVQS